MMNAFNLSEQARAKLKYCQRCDLFVGYDNRGDLTADPNRCYVCGLQRGDAPTLEKYISRSTTPDLKRGTGLFDPGTCNVCEDELALGVAAVPGVPISVAYCRSCLQANAHPLWILVANTASAVSSAESWRHDAADWWQGMVDDTLHRLDKTEDEFVELLRAEIEEFNRYVSADSEQSDSEAAAEDATWD
jgi:hypothetical protein